MYRQLLDKERGLGRKPSPRKGQKMTFKYYTKDGKIHYKTIDNKEHDKILAFIEWLETDKSVIKWY